MVNPRLDLFFTIKCVSNIAMSVSFVSTVMVALTIGAWIYSLANTISMRSSPVRIVAKPAVSLLNEGLPKKVTSPRKMTDPIKSANNWKRDVLLNSAGPMTVIPLLVRSVSMVKFTS